MFGKKTILFAVVILSMFIAGIATHVSSATTLQGGRMAALQGSENFRSDGPCWTCDAIVTCTQCMPSDGGFIMCTNNLETYTECPRWGDTQSDHCGTCLDWPKNCGQYKTCPPGPGCTGCSGILPCWGCNSVLNPNWCP
jgi:hypothetical protein